MGLISRIPPGHYDITNFAGLDTAPKYNGTDIVTTALNACLDYCRDNALIALWPRNTIFKVDDTIRAMKNDADVWAYPGQVCVNVGQQGGTPPKVRLVDGATGFGTGANKPVVHILRTNATGLTYAQQLLEPKEAASTLYRSVWSGIDIDCGNNPGAHGLLFDAAQECLLTDTSITGTNYKIGISGLPGRCVCSRNLSISGTMQYGIYTQNFLTGGDGTSLGAVIAGLTIEGSTVTAIYHTAARAALAIAGFICRPASGRIGDGLGYIMGEYGNFSIIDGLLELPTASSTAFNVDLTTLALWNCWVKNASAIANHNGTGRDYAGNGSGWFYVERYKGGHATADATTSSLNGTKGMPRKFRDTAGSTAATALIGAGNGAVLEAAVPSGAALLAKHYYRPIDPTDATVIYATESTDGTAACFNNGTTDNTTRIQDKVNHASVLGQPLFFPPGTYRVSQTLTLPAHAKVYGAMGSLARFQATSAWRTAVTTAAVQAWYIDTVAYANGTAILDNIVCDCLSYTAGQTWLGFHRWRLGRNSIRAQLVALFQAGGRADNPITMVKVQGPEGGGKAYGGIQAFGSIPTGTFASLNQNFRHVTFENVTEPTTLYGFNAEWGGAIERCPSHAPLVLFNNARNILILAAKTECWEVPFEVINNSRILCMMAGFLGIYEDTIDTGTYPIGQGVLLEAGSSLETGSVTFTSAETASPYTWLPGADTTRLVSDTDVFRDEVLGGYENVGSFGTLMPLSTWDTVSGGATPDIVVTWPTQPRSRAAVWIARTMDPAVIAWRSAVHAAGGTVSPDVAYAMSELFRRLRRAGIYNGIRLLQLLCTNTVTGITIPQIGTQAATLTGLGAGQYTLRSGFTKTAAANQRVETGLYPELNLTTPSVTSNPWGMGALVRLPADISGTLASMAVMGGNSTVTPFYRLRLEYQAPDRRIIMDSGGTGASINGPLNDYARQTVWGTCRESPNKFYAIADGRIFGNSTAVTDHTVPIYPVWVGVVNRANGEQFASPIGTQIFGYYFTGPSAGLDQTLVLHDALLSFLREIGRV